MTEPEIPRRIILDNGTEIWAMPEWCEGDYPEVETGMKYWTGPCQCSLCGHETVVVIEIAEDLEEPIVPMECGACGNQSMQVKEEEDD